MPRGKILAIAGPTASGKTALAVKVASDVGGEVVSFDSMQIYEGMEIGSAAPTEDEMMGVPHHFIGCVPPERTFSCADYTALATPVISDIIARGKLPVLCGGTGLYLENLIYNNTFSPDIPPDVKEAVDALGNDEAYEKLKKVDPASAESIHKNNVRRVKRALSIALGTGKTKTEWDAASRKGPVYDVTLVLLSARDREYLYKRINERTEKMLADGFIEEAKSLRGRLGKTAAGAIGYREIYDYLDGKLRYDEMKEKIAQNTRRYAKRQITWFSRYDFAHVFYIDEQSGEEIAAQTASLLD